MLPNASAIVPFSAGSRPESARAGFTLLEILVVLFMMAIVAALAMPQVTAMYDAAQRRLDQDEALQRIGSLGFMAYNHGVELEITHYPDPQLKDFPFSLPTGWSFTAENPILYNFNGICSGGVLNLRSPDRVIKVTLSPPFCRARVSES